MLLVAAAAVFVACLAVQFAGYDRILAAGLRDPEVDGRRRALKRWVVFAVAWQALVIAGVLAYALVVPRAGLAWIAPPVAALLGTALPYQLAASRLIRAGLGS
ncbi:MAG TPA: hypothetical protein VLW53_05415 [Candidatus Eisenbacteria bacterium]|nr:hypothetical protein [Candidatus Eisenbacteria bacterium]